MDSCDDVTDDLLGLPGFIRRNLLLMRELDLRFVSYLNDAKKKEQALLSTFSDTPPDLPSSSDKAEAKNDTVTTPTRRMGSDGEKGVGASKGRPTKNKGTADSKQKPANSETKRPCRSGSFPSAGTTTGGPNNPSVADSSTSEEIEEIQKLRMDAMYLVQEKLAINDQITCMLKHEYENLKLVFDNMYREMETTGQMTDKLRMSFTVNKSKPQMLIDSVLSQTEMDLLDDGGGTFATDADGATVARATAAGLPQGTTASVPQRKDTITKQ